MSRSRPFASVVATWTLLAVTARAGTNDWFRMDVLDAATGRGVPLVELRTVNQIAHWTDNHGIIAFQEPGLMDREVYFHVRGHGYEYPADGFGNRGLKLIPTRGGRATIRINRLNLAERLYRVTGQGLYRDSVLVGQSVPLKHPVLNGGVLGQDTVVVTPYRGQLFWFWGDTDRASYPLGQFAASGAVSDLPGKAGLRPDSGVDLSYFTDATGFSRRMCPGFGEGLHWIESVMTVHDAQGQERLVARVSSQRGLMPAYAWHLAIFDDRKGTFESKIKWNITDGHDSAHPFRANVDGADYLYLYPNYRVKADLQSLSDLEAYEAFTCVRGRWNGTGAKVQIDRDDRGRPRYEWRKDAGRLHPGRLRELVSAGALKPDEAWIQLRDIGSGNEVQAGRGSVFWNVFRRRWIMIVSGRAGEVWFAEGDTPTGPWVYACRVVSHDAYNFYNPTQHPFFDEDGGRRIYFEGTYTAAFSAATERTPRYDYNQVMYRLALDSEQMVLPVPVYQVNTIEGQQRYLTREDVERSQLWDRVSAAPFFALGPDRARGGTIPLFEHRERTGWILRDSPPAAGGSPVFFALPGRAADGDPGPTDDRSPMVLPLYEFLDLLDGRHVYTTDPEMSRSSFKRSEQPVCRVWRNPMSVLALDSNVKPR